jgi:tRNA (guanine37-N1)-methyltransferase
MQHSPETGYIDVFCVFPEAVRSMLGVGVVGRAVERGTVGLRCFDLREYAPGGRIDDMPYGGGAGMVVRADVVSRALEDTYGVAAREVREGRTVLVTEPGGRAFDQGYARELAGGISGGWDLTIICGRYGGLDERVRTELASGAVSIGDFVLSGGEIAAAAISDAVIRLLDGVLGNSESLMGESFSEAEPESLGPPQYTRPAEWDGASVPAVLLSGNHAEIRRWRESESRERPDSSEKDKKSAETS